MQKVLKESDFVLRTQFKDTTGSPTPIPLKFTLTYSTQGSKSFTASYDGYEYKNCRKLNSTTIEVIFNDQKFSVGQIRCKREYSVQSSAFPDNRRDFKQNELIPIVVVESYDDDYQCTTNSEITVDYVIIETGKAFMYSDLTEAQKSDLRQGMIAHDDQQTVRSLSAYDNSLYSEQIVVGEFAVDFFGVKRQVYMRTIRVEFPLGHGMGEIWSSLGLVPALRDLGGIVSLDSWVYIVEPHSPETFNRVTNIQNQGYAPFIFAWSSVNYLALYAAESSTVSETIIMRIKYFYNNK